LRTEALLKITRLADGKVVATQEIMSDLQRTGDHVPQTQVSRWPDGFSISVDTSRHKYVVDGQNGKRAYLTRIDLAGDFTAGIDILTPHLDERYADGSSTLSLIAETIVTGPRGPVTISAKANADRSRFHIHVSCGAEVGELLLNENGKLIESRSGHSAHEVRRRPGAGRAAQDR
jgi:phage baseplate assembly protein gpV